LSVFNTLITTLVAVKKTVEVRKNSPYTDDSPLDFNPYLVLQRLELCRRFYPKPLEEKVE
jgi:hypothetical protein